VAAVLVLNTPDDGRLRPKHVEWLCRNKTCTVLHQVGVSFDLLEAHEAATSQTQGRETIEFLDGKEPILWRKFRYDGKAEQTVGCWEEGCVRVCRQHARTSTQVRRQPSCYPKFATPRNCCLLITICMEAVTACMRLVKGITPLKGKLSRKKYSPYEYFRSSPYRVFAYDFDKISW